jgi:hypothetical protein
MPACVIEYCDIADAEWREFHPRIETTGKSFRDELVTVKGTQRQMMEHLMKLFADWSPHNWINR